MYFYQIKLVIKENKLDEFVECLLSVSDVFRKEKGCQEFTLYRDIENKDTYSVVGEWSTYKALEKHFKNEKFSVLVGAARVLGEAFEMKIGETSEEGGFLLAKEKISLEPKQSTMNN